MLARIESKENFICSYCFRIQNRFKKIEVSKFSFLYYILILILGLSDFEYSLNFTKK
ncbi:MAG: hypothetical protein UZ09_BCD002000556 [Bacteroidetes bacterium OLB9]|nr:MAG: hypothetical protein UZ09_BCD002000556 [Bacteroidetes bacterium OLB9]